MPRKKIYSQEEAQEVVKKRNTEYRKSNKDLIFVKRIAKDAIWKLELKLQEYIKKVNDWNDSHDDKIEILHNDYINMKKENASQVNSNEKSESESKSENDTTD
jgi:hypothetical protein